jgi:predicted DNA binding CopG/RHH family protein
MSKPRRRKPGRPTDDPKGERLHVRLSSGDLKVLDILVTQRGLERSGLIRALIHQAHEHTKLQK